MKTLKTLINRWNDWTISDSVWRAIWTGIVESLVANVLAWGGIGLGYIIWVKVTGKLKKTEENS